MLRSLLCLVLFVSLSINAAADENAEKGEKAKTPAAPTKDAVKKAEPTKEREKEPEVPSWVPKNFLGTPVAKRLARIQADLDAAMAKRGPAREEAQKARHVASQAQQKADDLDRMVKFLESEKYKTMENGNKQLREFALDKADNENSQKIHKLEAQVRELTARLESANKPANKTNKARLEKKPTEKKADEKKQDERKPGEKKVEVKKAEEKPTNK